MNGNGDLALVLSGGGARAAYQAGVLAGLARRFPDLRPTIYTGISAGAFNAAYLAQHPGSFLEATESLVALWRTVSLDQTFHTDARRVAGYLARWSARLVSSGARTGRKAPGLIDSAPLREFFASHLEGRDGLITGIQDNLDAGRLRAVAVITLSFTSGETVVWVQGCDIEPWGRNGRVVVPTRLAVTHVLASAALPVIFPAVRLAGGWHGDGGVRLTAPFSPAIHLGAARILAVSTRRREVEPDPKDGTYHHHDYPGPISIGGHLLDAAFMDRFDEDARRLEKMNQICRALPACHELGLREVEMLVMRPSRNIKKLAAAHAGALPRSLRFARLGVNGDGSSEMLSLMMMVPEYVGELIACGEADARDRAEEVARLLGVPAPAAEAGRVESVPLPAAAAASTIAVPAAANVATSGALAVPAAANFAAVAAPASRRRPAPSPLPQPEPYPVA